MESSNSFFSLNDLTAEPTRASTTVLETGWVAEWWPWRISRLSERLLEGLCRFSILTRGENRLLRTEVDAARGDWVGAANLELLSRAHGAQDATFTPGVAVVSVETMTEGAWQPGDWWPHKHLTKTPT